MKHYEFEARVPFDHVMHLISSYREGTLLTEKGDNLMCVGSAVGEVGALVKNMEEPEPIGALNSVRQMSLDELIDEFEQAFPAGSTEPVQISPFLAALLQRLLELLLDQLLK